MKKIFRIIVLTVIAMGLTGSWAVAAENAKLEEAKKLYVEAVPLAVDSPKRADLLKQAADILKKIIEDDPRSLDAHRKLLGVYLLQQDYSNSIRTMQQAVRISPQDPKLFITLAFLYEHSGEYEYSEAMLTHVLEMDPKNETAKDYLVSIRKKIETRRLNESHQGGVMPVDKVHGAKAEGNPHKGMSLLKKGPEAAEKQAATSDKK